MQAIPLKEMIYHFLPKAKKKHRDDFREDRIRLLKICDILHKYKQLPSTWQEVTQHHVDLIVKALAKRKYSASSIMNYLRSLRNWTLDKF